MALMSWLVCLWATRRISSPKPSSLNCCTVYLQHLISLQMCCDKEWESSFWSEIWHKYTFPKRSICLLLTNAAHLGRFSFPFCCTAIAGHKDTPRLYCAHLCHTKKNGCMTGESTWPSYKIIQYEILHTTHCGSKYPRPTVVANTHDPLWQQIHTTHCGSKYPRHTVVANTHDPLW